MRFHSNLEIHHLRKINEISFFSLFILDERLDALEFQ